MIPRPSLYLATTFARYTDAMRNAAMAMVIEDEEKLYNYKNIHEIGHRTLVSGESTRQRFYVFSEHGIGQARR